MDFEQSRIYLQIKNCKEILRQGFLVVCPLIRGSTELTWAAVEWRIENIINKKQKKSARSKVSMKCSF